MKTKFGEWKLFAAMIDQHVIDYCVPQYGDYPDEMIEKMSLDDLRFQIEKYAGRIGRGVRGEEEAIRDCYKIAHYACILHTKITK